MIIQQWAVLEKRGWAVPIIALCVCVLMQMLGMPGTLLDAADMLDHPMGSALEGFSILPALPELRISTVFILLIESRLFAHAQAFASAVFHPPVQ